MSLSKSSLEQFDPDQSLGVDEGSNGSPQEDEKQAGAGDQRGNGPSTPFSPAREAAFVFTICMAQFLSVVGLAQTVAPLDIIGRSFNVTDEGLLSWYTAAFSLTVGTFILPAGRLGDMYGHRKMCMIGYAWYAAFSVIAGVSVYSGDILLSIARGGQGIGPALVVPNALALVGIAYGPSTRKNMIFAMFGASAPTGWVAGATMSSVFAQLAWWPWLFFAQAIACVAMIGLTLITVPPADPAVHDPNRKFSDFDLLGSVTGVCGLILFNFAWNQAALVGWDAPYIIVLLVISIALLAAFAFVEIRIAKHPLVPIREMTGDSALALAVVAAGWASFGIWVFYLWRLIESIRGYSALAACAQNAPVALTGLIAALATGFLLSHIKVSYVLLISTLCFLTGQILIATAPVDQTYWAQTFVSIVIMPWGMDMSFPSGTILLSNNTPSENQGLASSLVNTAVNYSISLGLGIAGTVIRYTQKKEMSGIASFRNAWYFGIGLDVLAVAIALYFVWKY